MSAIVASELGTKCTARGLEGVCNSWLFRELKGGADFLWRQTRIRDELSVGPEKSHLFGALKK